MNVQLNRDERRLVVVNAITGLFIFVKLIIVRLFFEQFVDISYKLYR